MSRSLWEQWARAQRSQIDENDGLGGFWSRWEVPGNAGFRTVMFRRPPGGVGSTEIVLWRARGGAGATKIVFWRAPGGAGSTKIVFWRGASGAGTTKIVFWRAPGGAGTTKIVVSATPRSATPGSNAASNSYPGPHQSIHFLYDSHSENGILRD